MSFVSVYLMTRLQIQIEQNNQEKWVPYAKSSDFGVNQRLTEGDYFKLLLVVDTYWPYRTELQE